MSYRNDFVVCSEDANHTFYPTGAPFDQNTAGVTVCAECAAKLTTVIYVCPNGETHSGIEYAAGVYSCTDCGTPFTLGDLILTGTRDKTPVYYINHSQIQPSAGKVKKGTLTRQPSDEAYVPLIT
jgi:hypothetical protein